MLDLTEDSCLSTCRAVTFVPHFWNAPPAEQHGTEHNEARFAFRPQFLLDVGGRIRQAVPGAPVASHNKSGAVLAVEEMTCSQCWMTDETDLLAR